MRDFLNEAVNLEKLAIDCQYVHNENIVQISKLEKLRDLTLRNCQHVTDFGPLANLSKLHSIVIDMGDKGDENQLINIIRGSKNWRVVIFNETIEWISNKFFFAAADHFRQHKCPVSVFHVNTEKTEFPFVCHDWVLPSTNNEGCAAVLEACPLMKSFGACSWKITDWLLFKIADFCPRIRVIMLNHSSVSNDGVSAFYEKLLAKRAEYAGFEWKEMCIDVSWAANVTEELLVEAERRYGHQLELYVNV